MMFRKIAFAALMTLGTATLAQAQDNGPRLIGGGPDAQVVYSTQSQNVVGGGIGTLVGEAASRHVAYSATILQPSSGLVGKIIGGGDERQLVYVPATASGSTLAGQARHYGG